MDFVLGIRNLFYLDTYYLICHLQKGSQSGDYFLHSDYVTLKKFGGSASAEFNLTDKTQNVRQEIFPVIDGEYK